MKKDIIIPEVKDVFMAIVKEYNEDFKCDDWNAYIINNKEVDLDMFLIVSKGDEETTKLKTSILRKKIDKLPAKSYAKVEYINPAVLRLNNIFDVTFFEGTKMFDKTFTFKKGTVKEGSLRMIPLLKKEGVLVK
ncbi:hypothetical protein [Flavicella sp.]|uniref:hypothetical protein n=1 Tax=Flavicella sp. TaxID=2957742 RepID=UPI0026348AD7|nr:hypothetical protein [Flavicella sp.]MDG1805268.1 hypothetical protein [Flavicella sp.]